MVPIEKLFKRYWLEKEHTDEFFFFGLIYSFLDNILFKEANKKSRNIFVCAVNAPYNTGTEFTRVMIFFLPWRNSHHPLPVGQGFLIHEISRSYTKTHRNR